ncbi:receptor-type adenylate cyclase GRESAG 4,putative [Trypanosoma brucei gambiense DAL972]|uniref:adenylate cyclase n=1 Tax=Trypanosoma brucei gambiense (strain MHOM/CI/86/DAL972) TaxID=679716 RepID=C9ZWQ5_TRYB9|nr:receptor-type adenylate cyclase GRESAG 4,putative [Trypanosoma brucei gambiense DAL972]CBH13844.1 receptor-type adenylate cyclase GRESAG 4,putative [Trypanosoma brucei gambiense DAL972]|eukprot:XP_011776120.1 receptor-type adenylate cyclase GRESAG 4,putative [Trypanosoma brucei gambiense DAL972]
MGFRAGSMCARGQQRIGAPLLLSFLLLSGPWEGVEGKGNITVKVYSFLRNKHVAKRRLESVTAGFNASIQSRSSTLPQNVVLEIVTPPDDGVPLQKFLEEGLKKGKGELPIVLGPVGDRNTLSVTSYLHKEKIVAFSPITGSLLVRKWRQNLYYLTASPAAEVLALIRYAVSQLRLRRLGFMYLKGVSFGDKEYKMTVKAMSMMGRKLCGVFEIDGSTNGKLSNDDFLVVWNSFARTLPQGVIVFGSPIDETQKFVACVASDYRTRHAYLLLPSTLQFLVADTWSQTLDIAGRAYVPRQIILTGVTPLPTDTEYKAIRRFQEDMKTYMGKEFGNNTAQTKKGSRHVDDDVDGEMMVFGWIAGEVLSRALSSREWLRSREAFIKSLFSQRRYVIDDLVIGDFGGKCIGRAGESGAACKCNQGGNVVFMKEMVEDYRLQPVNGGKMLLNAAKCQRRILQLYAPLNGIMFRLEDNPLAQRIAEEYRDGASLVVGKGQLGQGDRFFLHELNSTSSATKHNMLEEVKERVVTAVFGVVDDALLSMTDMTFIDPIPLSPRLKHPGRNVLHLSPTIEQQIFVMVERVVVPNSWGSVHAIVRSSDARGIKSVLRKTFWALGGSLGAFDEVTDSESVKRLLPNSGFVLVIGLTEADITEIAEHLDNHRGVRVFVLFFDVVLLYSEFVKVFKKHPQPAERLLFATSLPHWADNNTTSETVQGFQEDVGNESKWTPLALLGYVTARAVSAVLPRAGYLSPEILADAIYTQSVIVVDGIRFRTFSATECQADSGFAAKGCAMNYGATHISVWSMARVLNPSVPPVTKAATPSMQYTHPNNGLSARKLAGIIVGSLFLVLLTVLLVVLLSFFRRHARDNENAPKELTDPVTLIFTDIDSSTAQWAAHPELMPDAVATHHRIIRTLISKYECYEVKTVGDSFMIACKSPFAAAQLACDLQRCFLEHDWKTDVFDTSYREFERQRAEGDGDYVPPTGHLDPDVYSRLWNGLRVRVGIHTGLCDIRHDEVTKGYDYYGRTSNMAARTGSVANGGQVLLTRSTYLAVTGGEREQLNVTALGDVPLRGVPKPVEMYQLNAVPERTFAALLLDCQIIDGTDEEMSTSASDVGSVAVELPESAQHVATSLETLLGTFTPAQRQALLMSVCERWRVTSPRKVHEGWDNSVCHDVICHIAARVGHVVNFGARNATATASSTTRQSSLCSYRSLGLCGYGSHGQPSSTNQDNTRRDVPQPAGSPHGSPEPSTSSSNSIHVLPFNQSKGPF